MFFFIKTNNPRPTFHLDMTAEERSIMEKHVAYWSAFIPSGKAIAFGPVLDPQGIYGIGLYNVENEKVLDEMLKNDPANGLLTYEKYQMPRLAYKS